MHITIACMGQATDWTIVHCVAIVGRNYTKHSCSWGTDLCSACQTFSPFSTTRRPISVFERIHHWITSTATWPVHITHTIHLISIRLLSFHWHFRCNKQNIHIFHLPRACYSALSISPPSSDCLIVSGEEHKLCRSSLCKCKKCTFWMWAKESSSHRSR